MQKISPLTQPVILGVFILFLAFGIGSWFDLYVKFSSFDTLVHFLGGACVAFFFARYTRVELDTFPHIKKILFLTACACFVGVLWECAEYASSVLSPEYAPFITNYFYIGTLADTLMDLIADMLGGLTFALLWIKRVTNN